MLASHYPFSFVLLAWFFVLLPTYPGLIVLATALFARPRRRQLTLLYIGLGLLVTGVLFMALSWDSIESGNPYHLF